LIDLFIYLFVYLFIYYKDHTVIRPTYNTYYVVEYLDMSNSL